MVDIVIIGSGPAGYISALKAAKMDKKVVLIEKDLLGGTCLNRGCIPTKSLLHTTKEYFDLFKLANIGINVDKISINNEILDSTKNNSVDKLRKGIEFLLKNANVEVIYGEGKIIHNNLVKVNDQTIETKYILVATGSKPRLLNIKGIEKDIVYTSDDLLKEFKDFDKIVIVGGGVIGVEFATIYSNLKKDVVLIEALDSLLSNMDREISSNLMMQLRKSKVKVMLKANINEILDDGIIVNGEKIETDAILMAVGRDSYIDNLFEDELLIKDGKSILVDDNFKTNIDNIYAVGDCINDIQLAHYASACGIYVVENIFKEESSINLDNIPSCVYTNMEIAEVGINEKKAKEKGINYKTGKFSMLSNSKSVVTNSDRGFIKVVVDENDYIIGASMMCDRASDLISIFTNIINSKQKLNDIKNTVYPHPSYSEGILEALEDVDKSALHIIYR